MTAALARVLDGAPIPSAPARRLDPVDCDLAVAGLEVRYGAAAPVFSDVSFAVARGEAVALIGPNGAGKSTLLKCCLGFVRPVAGEVRLFGERMVGLRPFEQRRLRGGVGFVAQKHNLVARLSVLSNVIHGMLSMQPGPRYWLQALASAKARAQALTALDRVGLADLALRRADSLSGGQSQRVAIARALIAEPRLILADEPAASLDPAAAEDVMAVFARVVRSTGTTLLFTTHHLEHALSYAGRVVGLRDGRLALDAPARDLQLESLLGIYG